MPDRRALLRLSALFASLGFAGCNVLGPGSPDEGPAPTETSNTGTSTSNQTAPSTQSESRGRTLDIRDFGAKVDGTTDDTEAVQRAVDEATPGDTVFFPTGVTALSPPKGYGPAVSITGKNGEDLTIEGKGPGSVVKMKQGIEDDRHSWLFGVDCSGDAIEGLQFRDLLLDGNRKQTPKYTTIGLNLFPGGSGHQISVRNVQAQNCSETGFRLSGGHIELERCSAMNNGRQGFGISPWVDTKRPEVELRKVLVVNNDKVGIDHNSGVALVDGFWAENNGQGGAKVPWEVKESTWRNGMLKNNGTMGFRYNGEAKRQKYRPFEIQLDKVVAIENPWAGFWFSGDVHYDIGTVAAIGNNTSGHQQGNIEAWGLSKIRADNVFSSEANGAGLYYASERKSAVSNYRFDDNDGRWLSGKRRSNISFESKSNGAVPAIEVPDIFEVGAWSSWTPGL